MHRTLFMTAYLLTVDRLFEQVFSARRPLLCPIRLELTISRPSFSISEINLVKNIDHWLWNTCVLYEYFFSGYKTASHLQGLNQYIPVQMLPNTNQKIISIRFNVNKAVFYVIRACGKRTVFGRKKPMIKMMNNRKVNSKCVLFNVHT